ncbi:MAG: tetratricopeptide repeat protein [Bryobacterales bacterium]|nr:tetratricopeptide repeat protein [Bryobacterales bacterium]
MWKKSWVLAAYVLLSGITLAVYTNHFGNSFHFDDFHTIVDNVRLHTLNDPMQYFRDPAAFSVLTTHQVFRPLVSLSLAFDYSRGRGATAWFHYSTFFWFLVLVGCLLLVFERVLHSSVMALAMAALFALHPVSAETVNYIIQRGDLYATLGIAAALFTYAAYPRLRVTGLYLIPFALGALSKATALVFPLILALYLWTYEEQRWQRLLLRLMPAALAAVVLGTWIGRMTGAAYQPGGFAPGLYRATQGYVTWHYFYSFFLPTDLTADTDMKVAASYADPRVLGGVLFLALVAAAIYLAARAPQWRGAAFGLGWFLIALIPTAMIPLAEVANDHRMFMAFPGLCIALGVLLKNWLNHRVVSAPWLRYAAVACFAVALAAAAYATRLRNEVWRTEETLWQDVTVKSPGNGRGLMNYGLTLMARGDTKTALDYFERAARITPFYPVLEINRAVAKGELGRQAEAERHFRNAIQWSPGQSSGYFYYGRWLNWQRRSQEAETNLRQAVQLNPHDFQARALLSQVYAQRQRWKELRELVEETLRIAPGDPTALHFRMIVEANELASRAAEKTAIASGSPESHLQMSLTHFRAGRYLDCVRAAEKALQLRPDYAEAYNNIAAGYNALKMWDKGIEAAKQAVRLKPDWELARNNLAHAMEQKAAAVKAGQ